MSAPECPFRLHVELPFKLQEARRKLVDKLNLTLDDPSASLKVSALTSEPVCTHEDGPFLIFAGVKDQYYCDFCIRNNLCPLNIKPESLLC